MTPDEAAAEGLASDAPRISTFFGCDVFDRDGHLLGTVHDVRLRRDGAYQPGFGPALRVEGLIVGRGSVASRLGFDEPRMAGPWPLDVWGRRAARAARIVPMDCLAKEGDRLVCTRPRDELEPAGSESP